MNKVNASTHARTTDMVSQKLTLSFRDRWGKNGKKKMQTAIFYLSVKENAKTAIVLHLFWARSKQEMTFNTSGIFDWSVIPRKQAV